jgi:hypothetical protein
VIRRALCLSLALGATLAGSPPAAADPALPAGWIAGGPAAPMPPAPTPGRRSRDALQLAQSPPRPVLAPVPLALADLDAVDLQPAPTDAQIAASNAEATGEPPTDLFVAPGCGRASVSGHNIGTITVDWQSRPIAPQSGAGVSLGGSDGKHLYVRASWETIDSLPDGTLRFTETVARFHVLTCKAKVARRYSVIARPSFGGLAYLFRARCAACAPEQRDVLHAITPAGEWGSDPFTHNQVALVPGVGQGFLQRVSPSHRRNFGELLRHPVADAAPGMVTEIGVESAQTLGERAPTLIAYAAEVPERGFGF